MKTAIFFAALLAVAITAPSKPPKPGKASPPDAATLHNCVVNCILMSSDWAILESGDMDFGSEHPPPPPPPMGLSEVGEELEMGEFSGSFSGMGMLSEFFDDMSVESFCKAVCIQEVHAEANGV